MSSTSESECRSPRTIIRGISSARSRDIARSAGNVFFSDLLRREGRLRFGLCSEDVGRHIAPSLIPNPMHSDNVLKFSISNSMTVLEDLLPIALDMLKNRRFGTWNFVNPGAISHDEILSMYRDIVDPSFTWENFSLEEQRQILRADRSNNTLDTERLEVISLVLQEFLLTFPEGLLPRRPSHPGRCQKDVARYEEEARSESCRNLNNQSWSLLKEDPKIRQPVNLQISSS